LKIVLKEWTVFCIRNLCENEKVVEYINNLEYLGIDQSLLEEIQQESNYSKM
jgi:hypothetical protein